LKTFGRRYATRFAFGVFKPALKRGPTFDRRYRGKVKSVIGKALRWKRGPTFNCRYRGKVKLVIGKALDWKRRSSFDCRYRGRSIRRCVKSRLLKTFGRRYTTRFAFRVFKPALKRGPTFDRRYRGKVKSVIGKALGWKCGPTFNCRYRGRGGLRSIAAIAAGVAAAGRVRLPC
jgi:Ni/Co efflux regulator RcnB